MSTVFKYFKDTFLPKSWNRGCFDGPRSSSPASAAAANDDDAAVGAVADLSSSFSSKVPSFAFEAFAPEVLASKAPAPEAPAPEAIALKAPAPEAIASKAPAPEAPAPEAIAPKALAPVPVPENQEEEKEEEEQEEQEQEQDDIFPSESSLGRPLLFGDVVWGKRNSHNGRRYWPAVVLNPFGYNDGGQTTSLQQEVTSNHRPPPEDNCRLVLFVEKNEEVNFAWQPMRRIKRCALIPYSDQEARAKMAPPEKRLRSGGDEDNGGDDDDDDFIQAVAKADELLAIRQRLGLQTPVVDHLGDNTLVQ